MRGLLLLTLLAGTIVTLARLEQAAHRSHYQHITTFTAPCKAFADHWYLDGDGQAHPRTATTDADPDEPPAHDEDDELAAAPDLAT